MKLVPEMTYTLKTNPPAGTTTGSATGAVQYWYFTEAALDGPRIHATLAAPGSDWMLFSQDGFSRPDVRMPFVTDDGAPVLMRYTGLVERTDTFLAAADSQEDTNWEDQYMRMAITFVTGDERYAWLATSLFVAAGRLVRGGRIEYDVRRVS